MSNLISRLLAKAGYAWPKFTQSCKKKPANKITRSKKNAYSQGFTMEPLEPRLLLSADLSIVGAGLQSYLNNLEPAIVQQIERAPLPVIGNQVSSLGNPIKVVLDNTVNAIQTGLTPITSTSTAAELQTALFNTLAPKGLLLSNPQDSDNGAIRLEDIHFYGTADAPEFSMILGGNLASFNLATDSRLGLPAGLGLNLTSTGTVQAALNYKLQLDFGIDSGGFFVNAAPFGAGNAEATVNVDLSTPNLNVDGTFGVFKANFKDVVNTPTHLNGMVSVLLLDPNNDGLFHPATETPKFDGQLSGNVVVDLNTTVSVNGDPRYPSFGTQLFVKWGLGFPSDAAHPETFGNTPDVSFNNTTLKLGSFIGDALNSTLSPIANVISPAQPLLDVLTMRLPVVSDLAGKNITLLDLFGGPNASTLDIVSQVSSALTMVNQVSGLGNNINLNLGSFSFASSDIRSNDIRTPGFSLATATPTILGTKVNLAGELFGWTAYPNLPSLVDGKSELQLPFLTDPLKAFGILLGKPVDLISFNPPPASFAMSTGLEFPIVGPLVAKLSAGLGFNLNIGFGYDTSGLYALAQGGSATDLAKGVFIRGATDANGNVLPVMTLSGYAQAGAAVDLGLIDAGVAGGVKADVQFSLNGTNGDGKERLANLSGGPLSALSADGSLEAYLRLFIDIGVGPFSVPFNIDVPLATILDFSGGGAQPQLAQFDPMLGDGVLRLNVGAFAPARNFHPNTVDESISVRHIGGTTGDETVAVVAFGHAQFFQHVKKIYADAGDGDNTLSATGYVASKDGTFSLVGTQWLVKNPDGFGGLNLTNNAPGAIDLYGPLTAVESPVEFHTGSGKDLLVGGNGANLLDAGADRDVLIGGAGPNTMLGGDGNDILVAGPGADNIDGGAGIDMVSYATASAGVSIDLGLGTIGGAAAGDVLTNIESLQGTAFDDTLAGDDNHNVLDGRQGNDTLIGRGGDDLLIGATGADVLDGGTGNNALSYANSTAAVNIDMTANTASGGDAQGDTLIGTFRAVEGSQFDDILAGSAAADQISGLGGNDLIMGRAGDDHLIGGSGNDYIIGGQGNDTIEGGLGSDIVLGDDGSIDAQGNVTLVYGTGGNDQIAGNEGIDRLYGQAGNDTINGGDGADFLAGGAGADSLGGDAGLDTVSYFDSPSAVVVDLSTQTTSGGDAQGDTLTSSIENAEGSAFNDVLISVTTATERNQAGSVLAGLAGDDLLIAGPVYYTTLDPVSLKVYKFGDVLIGGDGNDTASWENSTSGVVVNVSNSTIGYAGNTNAVVLSGHGELGWAQGDIVNTVENLRGSDWSDMLIGNDSNNVIDPRLDRDSVTWYYSSTSFPGTYLETRDFVDARGGSDTLKIDYSRGDTGTGMAVQITNGLSDGSCFGNVARWVPGADPTIYVAANYLDYVSFTAIDQFDITGTAENDILSGWTGDDVLRGGAGNDFIVARGGNGIFDGGSGLDTLSADLSTLSVPVTIDTATSGEQFRLDNGGIHLSISGFEVLGADGGTPVMRHLPIVGGSRFTFSDTELWFITGSGDDRLMTHGRYRDVISTGAGNDTVDPGLGLTTIEQGFQTGYQPGDQINLGSGDDTLVLDYSLGDTGTGLTMSSDDGGNLPGNNPGTSQAGEVLRYTAPGSSVLLDRVLVWGEEHVQVTGTNENDLMHGTPNDDVLLGRGGDDFITAGTGGGVLDGGSGTDLLNANLSAITQAIVLDTANPFSLPAVNLQIANFERLGSVDAYGRGGFFTGSGNDIITTHGRLNDAVYSGLGDDRVNLGLGIDRFDPGSGNNTVVVDYSTGDIGQAMTIGNTIFPLIYRRTADSSALLDALYFANYSLPNFIYTGTSKSDALIGGDGTDTLTGVIPTAILPGKGEIDSLTGGKGADLFVLGDARTAYYDDGITTGDGSNDFARIRDFNPAQGDVIALHGSASDYQLVATAAGTRIVLNKSANEPGEMIGLIENPPVGLSLSNGFRFTGNSLQVSQFTPTDSGFTLRFTQALDPATLNLYSGDPTRLGVPDLVLLGPDGKPISGSIILDADRQGLTFLRTGGALLPGHFVLTLASRIDGFVTPGGLMLDGNADGIGTGTVSDNYVTAFDVALNNAAVLAVGEVARGPGQTLANPAAAYNFPIVLNNAAGAKRVDFTLNYNPNLLTVTGFSGGVLPTGSTVTVDTSTAGQLHVSVLSPTAFVTGTIVLGNLEASVPITAVYGAKDLLHFSAVSLDSGVRLVHSDDGLHIVAFVGDTSGDGSYTTLDFQRFQRVLLKQDSGFGAWPLVDPVIIGDIDHNGLLQSVDALKLAYQVGGTNQKDIPAIPAGLPPMVFAGADPSVTLGSVTAAAGSQAIVPVNIDTAAGLQSVQLTIRYDASALTLMGVEKTALSANFLYFVTHTTPGELVIDATSVAPLIGGSGVLFNLDFAVAPAVQGTVAIDFVSARLNDTWLTVNPAPSAGLDPSDGVINVLTTSPTVLNSSISNPGRTKLSLNQKHAHTHVDLASSHENQLFEEKRSKLAKANPRTIDAGHHSTH